MSIDTEKKIVDTQSTTRRVKRCKPSNYPSEVYGARLKLDDAKILDDYAKKHNLERADVVRLGLHQFALHQQMLVRVEKTESELQEQSVSEQIAPLKAQLDELSEILNSFTAYICNNHQQNPSATIRDDFDIAKQHNSDNEFASYFEKVFTEQRQILEKILVTVTLAFRLYVDYTVEPALRTLTSSNTNELAAYLQAADKGREYWSEATRQVIRRTGNRVLLDLNFLPKESENEQQTQQR